METITVKGKVYQVGTLYQDGSGEYARLKSADESKSDPFVLMYHHEMGTTTKTWKEIFKIEHSIGTIEDAPLELEKGFWYMCESFTGQPNQPYKYFGDSDNCSPLWSHEDSERNKATYQLKPLHKMGEIK